MANKNSNHRERKEKLLKFMKEAGAWKISPAVITELSKEFSVTERQIYLDTKNVIKKIPKPVVSETAKKFLISWDYAINKSITLMRNPDEDIATKGIKLFFEAVDKYTNFLHQYGFKEQVAGKLNITGDEFTINLIEKSVEEIKSGKPTNKPESKDNDAGSK